MQGENMKNKRMKDGKHFLDWFDLPKAYGKVRGSYTQSLVRD